MAFQEFSHFSERRKAERQQKLRKRIIAGVFSSIVIVAVIAVAAISVVHYQNKGGHGTNAQSRQQGANGGDSHEQDGGKETFTFSSEKAIKTMCASVNYQDRCVTSLSNMVKTDPKLATPKELVKAAIQVAAKEVADAFDKMSAFKFETPQERDAFEDCKELMETAKEELAEAVSEVSPSRTHDVNTWLSAVMSYTQTCIDGFPEGKAKTQIEKTYEASKELTSNSLAIVNQMSSVFSLLNVAKRNLLQDNEYPAWMSADDRRILKAEKHDEAKLSANTIVAKDGSGNFTTISAALEAMPKEFKGR